MEKAVGAPDFLEPSMEGSGIPVLRRAVGVASPARIPGPKREGTGVGLYVLGEEG